MAQSVVTTRILRRLLKSGAHFRAEKLLERVHPADLGPILKDLTPDEIRIVIDLLFKHRRAARMLRELPPEMLPEIIEAVSDQRLADVLNRLEIDDMLELVSALPEDRRDVVLQHLPPTRREELRHAGLYPPHSAGRAMTTNYAALDEKMTAQEAIDSLRAMTLNAGDAVLYLYVVDELKRLTGVVPIRRLVTARSDTPVRDLAIREMISTSPDADQEEVAKLVARYDLLAIPVTDVDGTMLGIITVDDVMDVAEDEMTEDMQKIGGMDALDAAYSQTSLWQMVRKRGVWLAVLFVGELFTASAMAHYEQELARALVLTLFIPLIISSGGNSGSQAASLLIRALALKDVALADWWRVMRRELAAGLALGTVLGLLGFVRVSLWQWLGVVSYGEHSFLIAMAIGLSLVGVVTFGTLVGALLPFLLQRLGLDPATSSAPFVATLVDVTGLVIYFSVALLILRGTLL